VGLGFEQQLIFGQTEIDHGSSWGIGNACGWHFIPSVEDGKRVLLCRDDDIQSVRNADPGPGTIIVATRKASFDARTVSIATAGLATEEFDAMTAQAVVVGPACGGILVLTWTGRHTGRNDIAALAGNLAAESSTPTISIYAAHICALPRRPAIATGDGNADRAQTVQLVEAGIPRPAQAQNVCTADGPLAVADVTPLAESAATVCIGAADPEALILAQVTESALTSASARATGLTRGRIK
jgi:hypothetical protein